jgi:hypothetical protein
LPERVNRVSARSSGNHNARDDSLRGGAEGRGQVISPELRQLFRREIITSTNGKGIEENAGRNVGPRNLE